MIIPKQYALAAKLLACVLALGAVSWTTHSLTANHYQAKIATINAEHSTFIADNARGVAETLLNAERERAAAYRELSESRGKIDEQYRKDYANISRSIADLRNVQLRDPGTKAPTNGSGSGISSGNSPGTGSGNETSSGTGVLSQQATGFLWDFAGESEDVAASLRACKAWEQEIRSKVDAYNKSLFIKK